MTEPSYQELVDLIIDEIADSDDKKRPLDCSDDDTRPAKRQRRGEAPTVEQEMVPLSPGRQRDAWFAQKNPVLTEEEKVIDAQTKVRLEKRLAWYREDPTRLFGPEYHLFRLHGLNNWRDVFPNLEDMPPGWPGKGLDHGLRDEHLSPRYWRHVYKGGDRNECGERIHKQYS
ncbi:hypothetical protein M413DRAFT_444478 [Hebeloma cylindrosporum]|uniref:Uncharacterized protein n=1 Tax=Hebeloma cylindrosporum TaxID=76867 RepID=A0A0C3CGT5_HEBCY|nr:hypothetical protein M413DRAFT_444478 [Hebeloma cylindrosporum h7]